MSRRDIQYRFDQRFPRGVNLQFVQDTPADPDNAQYFVPRVLVTAADEKGYEIFMDATAEGKEWNFRIEREEEDYGSTDTLNAYLFLTTTGDTLYMTSHITDAMDTILRQFEQTRLWFEEAR